LNETYFHYLSSSPFEIDGADEFLNKLSQKYNIYVITNGVKRVQTIRLSLVNITKYFKKIYISEEVGYQKPNIEYFEYVLNDLKITNKEDLLIIGDSLSSDIKGGINSGIDTMWYNPKYLTTDVKYTYQIHNYDEFFEIIK
jgi:HAD superfamily hydrolase (TIGR01549 family)